MQRWLAFVVAGFFMAASCAAQSRFAGNEIVVRYRGEDTKAGAQSFAARRRLEFKQKTLMPGVAVLDGGPDADATLAALRSDPEVIYAERNHLVYLTETIPNDPLFASQWQLRNVGQTGGTAGASIHASEAWDVTTGSASIVVGIVDTGMDTTHNDLMGRLWTNPGEIPGNSIDDDHNGFVDDVNGWNFYNNTNNISPTLSHGTSVAGAVGATTNNTNGIAGTDWNCRMMIVNSFGPSGTGTEADVVNGTLYAINNGARIVNASWGDYDYSYLLEDMAIYAAQHGVLICAAAGNNNLNADAYPFYPACLPYDSIISVGGTDAFDTTIYNYGQNLVHIAAPASLDYLTEPGGYGMHSGTSFAAPLVAATGALVLSVSPSLTFVQLKYRLMAAQDTPALLVERDVASGRLNAAKAVAPPCTGVPGAITDLAVAQTAENGVVLQFHAPPAAFNCAANTFYQLRVSTQTITSANFYELPLTPSAIRPAPEGTLERIIVNGLDEDTSYYFAARAVNASGTAGSLSNVPSTHLPPSATLFYDSCDTTSPFWTVNGFTLADGGVSHTGNLSWQDSPGTDYPINTSATLTGSTVNLTGLVHPRLGFYIKYVFPVSADRYDRLEVQASIDGGASWNALKRYHFTSSPMKRETIALDDLATATAARLRFYFTSDGNSLVGDGVYIDDIRIYGDASPVPESREIIIESMDFFSFPGEAPGYTQTGGPWTPDFGKSTVPRVEAYMAPSVPAGTAGAQARFTPLFTTPGLYEVYGTWGPLSGSSGETWHVASAGGIFPIVLAQSPLLTSRWISLGKFYFNYGRNPASGSVTLDASTASGGNVYSDAMRFRYAGLDSTTTGAQDWALFE